MKKNNLLKESIVEASKMREAAIKLAKSTLQESLTTQIQRRFASRLDEEMEDDNELNEGDDISDSELDALVNEAFGDHEDLFESEDKYYGESDDDDDDDDILDLDEILREIDANDEKKKEEKKSEKEPKKNDKEPKKYDKEPKKDDKEPKKDDKKSTPKKSKDDEDIASMTPEELEELIREIVREETQGEGAENNMPENSLDMGDMDMDAGLEPDKGNEPAPEGGEDVDLGDLGSLKGEPEDELKEEELDLDELLREIDDEDFEMKDPGISDEDNYEQDNLMESNKYLKKQLIIRTNYLNEALGTIKELNEEIKDINLLNSKLLYVNKLFKNRSLNESQKTKIIDAFDKAHTSNEAKLIYETLSTTSLNDKFNSKNLIKENLSIASKPVGLLKESKKVELDPTISRFQKLAGIK